MRTKHTWNENSAAIQVEGLSNPVKVFQITDSHISCDQEIDRPYVSYSNRMNTAFQDKNTTGLFQQMLQQASDARVDLLALTGDQVNYPSTSAVTFVADEVQKTGLPHLFTAGNHDWHYEGMEGSSETLREEWREKRLSPLYADHSPSHTTLDIGGLCFIVIDNSTYQMNEAQLSFYQQQISRGLPTVLLIHIPLSLPQMRTPTGPNLCGDPDWGAQKDRNYITERRQRWPESGNNPSTGAFLESVLTTPNLVAVLCGHIHTSRVDPINDHAFQYVTSAGCLGGYRLLEFHP